MLQLISAWKSGHDDVLVASAQCDGSGRDLCDHFGINSFPTMKFGPSPDSMREYNGGRDFDSMNEAVQSLGESPSVIA